MPVSRNALCPCGSGKKYKKCCYLKEAGKPSAAEIEKREEQLALMEMINKLRTRMLKNKPHIKKYYKLRHLHSEIMTAMVQYEADGKFTQTTQESQQGPVQGHLPEEDPAAPIRNGRYVSRRKKRESETVYVTQCEFDFNTREGEQAYYDLQIYKSSPNTSCIIEDFLQKNRYRRQDKIDFLHCMLRSKLGLYEVCGADENEGYVYLQNVFTKEKVTLTDVAMSGHANPGRQYLYLRIICCDGICFTGGLSFPFSADDAFIQAHIHHHAKEYNPDMEFLRFTQLYNYYSKAKDRLEVMSNPF